MVFVFLKWKGFGCLHKGRWENFWRKQKVNGNQLVQPQRVENSLVSLANESGHVLMSHVIMTCVQVKTSQIPLVHKSFWRFLPKKSSIHLYLTTHPPCLHKYFNLHTCLVGGIRSRTFTGHGRCFPAKRGVSASKQVCGKVTWRKTFSLLLCGRTCALFTGDLAWTGESRKNRTALIFKTANETQVLIGSNGVLTTIRFGGFFSGLDSDNRG